jgi:hypothetical protein
VLVGLSGPGPIRLPASLSTTTTYVVMASMHQAGAKHFSSLIWLGLFSFLHTNFGEFLSTHLGE